MRRLTRGATSTLRASAEIGARQCARYRRMTANPAPLNASSIAAPRSCIAHQSARREENKIGVALEGRLRRISIVLMKLR